MRNSPRGASLLETVIGLFILTIGIVLISTLLGKANRFQKKSLQYAEAALLAENLADEIRHWARQGQNGQYNYNGSWSNYQDQNFSDPNFPRYQIRCEISEPKTASPSLSFEEQHGEQGRSMAQSLKQATITVTWAEEEHRLQVYIPEPLRAPREEPAIAVSSSESGSLGRDGTREFRAQLFDENDEPIPDVVFRWSLLPMDGNATVDWQSRNGANCRVQNVVVRPNGDRLYTGGSVKVVARAVYAGEELIGRVDLPLVP